MDSRRTPYMQKNGMLQTTFSTEISLNDAYDMIEEYIREANIEFDLFTFSQHPNFNSLCVLLNQLINSLRTLFISFPPTFERVTQNLNHLFTMMFSNVRIQKSDLMAMNQNRKSLEAIMKPLAWLVRNRIQPLFSTMKRHQMPFNCKVEFDFDLDKIKNIIYDEQNNNNSEELFNLLKQMSIADITSDQLIWMIDEKIELTKNRLDQDLQIITSQINQQKQEIKEAKEFYDRTSDMFKDEQKFDNLTVNIEQQTNSTKKILENLCRHQRDNCIDIIAKPLLGILEASRFKYRIADRNEYIKFIDRYVEHINNVKENPENVEENQQKLKEIIEESIIKINQQIEIITKQIDETKKTLKMKNSKIIELKFNVREKQDEKRTHYEIKRLNKLKNQIELELRESKENIEKLKSDHQLEMKSLNKERLEILENIRQKVRNNSSLLDREDIRKSLAEFNIKLRNHKKKN